MQRIEVSDIVSLQRNTDRIRNICVLAHIDHGKTTLTDSLICSNGIISPKLAGKLRYLDSTEDEQQRGITMHSSAISLLFRLEDKANADSTASSTTDYLINLVDSPGHIDFSSDVSTATRLCDGALIVIDVLEGICTQTHAVIYKALKEGLTPCLVLNKIDRLCVELQLSSTEAFFHLRRILENVNALTYTLLNSESQLAGGSGTMAALEDTWNFSPSKGNVVFCSAFDTWGFGLPKFVNLYVKRLGLNRGVLHKYLFEDYCFNDATKKISKYDSSDYSSKPMFASMVLDPLWNLYSACVVRGHVEQGAREFMSEFGVVLPPRDINVRDPRGTSWLPLPDAILRTVVRIVPSPVDAQRERLPKLISDPGGALETDFGSGWKGAGASGAVNRIRSIVQGVGSCSTQEGSDVVVFLSKMVPVRVAELRAEDVAALNRRAKMKDPDAADLDPVSGEVMVALGRVFSGVVRKSARLLVLSHRHDPIAAISSHCATQDLDSTDVVPSFVGSTCTAVPQNSIGVYLFFGPSVHPVDEVPAGNIVGIVGIADLVLKTGTLSSSWLSPALKSMTFQAKPIVRVAVEPKNYYDLAALEKGLNLLYQYDPAVEIGVDAATGQHTMACLGEIHQEQCVKYLADKFARCEIVVSEPIVPFRETIVASSSGGPQKPLLPQPWNELVDNQRCVAPGVYSVDNAHFSLGFSARPLPIEFLALFENNIALKQKVFGAISTKYLDDSSSFETSSEWRQSALLLLQSLSELPAAVDESTAAERMYNRIVSIGPDDLDSAVNVLTLSAGFTMGLWTHRSRPEDSFESRSPDMLLSIDDPHHRLVVDQLLSRIHSALIAGFQLCVSAGPLMAEPLHGVCFVLEHIHVARDATGLSSAEWEDLLGAMKQHMVYSAEQLNFQLHTGQLISEVRDVMRVAYLSNPVRILEPVYSCTLQCDQNQLGNMYSVLSRRRGRVANEDVIEGTSLFLLTVLLPIVESFGFSPELLKQTSGSATTPLLVFSHWELLDVDPFWRATTVEELELGDSNAAIHNIAKTIIEKNRRRRGLAVEEKVVESAEKQRTLNKKK